ncbi:MAG: zinc-binding dehydrogenase [Phycisphaerae bacterium]
MQALTFDISAWRWLSCKALAMTWPRVYLSALGGLKLRDIPVPQLPGPDWVRLRTRLGGICGTDLGLILLRTHPANILRSFTSFPVILGHENVATVDQVGDRVDGWRVGQRVCVEPSLSCAVRGIDPPCGPCQRGLFSLCEGFVTGPLPRGTMIGLNNFTGGSWAPFFVAHQSQLHAVPDSLNDESAVLVDPLACALHGVLRHRPRHDDKVLIQGGGIIGLGVALALGALDSRAHVTALVRHRFQAERMQACGADEIIVAPRRAGSAQRYDQVAATVQGRRVPAAFGNQALIGGFDAVYDCVGTGVSLTDAMKFTRPRGTTVALGTSQICLVDTTSLWFKELNVVGVYGRQMESTGQATPVHTYRMMLDMIADGRLDVADLLTHTFKPNQYRQALALLTTRQRSPAVKVAFRHSAKS